MSVMVLGVVKGQATLDVCSLFPRKLECTHGRDGRLRTWPEAAGIRFNFEDGHLRELVGQLA